MIGGVAGLAVLLTLGDPGLTIDEPLDVRPGRTYLAMLRAEGLRFFERRVVDRVFRDNAEHPPLGRWLLGIASTVGEPFEILLRGADPTGLYVVSGRLAPALVFGLLVWIVAAEAARRWGRVAGVGAGVGLLLMPRSFAHAHFGALDTFLSLFWTLALLKGARAFEDDSASGWKAAGAGAFWSLALLTKIHAWLLAPLLAAWAISRLRWKRAAILMGVWFATGVSLYLAGWPWLWYDTPARWKAYLGTAVERATIQVQYFGRVMADRDVPWHYPWFYFAVVVPVGLHALGAFGLAAGCRRSGPASDPFARLLAGSIGLFLLIFSTRVPVYDGERLFLHVFPAWAMLVGLGFSRAWLRWGRNRMGRFALGAFLAAQGAGTLMYHPFGLSYYNLLVGGLRGAEGMGLEVTYWADAVDRVLLDELAREAGVGETAALAPSLYPGQGILTTTAALARREIILQDEAAALTAEWVIAYRRWAYWKPRLAARLDSADARRVAIRHRQGVWLSALWHFPPETTPIPGTRDRPQKTGRSP